MIEILGSLLIFYKVIKSILDYSLSRSKVYPSYRESKFSNEHYDLLFIFTTLLKLFSAMILLQSGQVLNLLFSASTTNIMCIVAGLLYLIQTALIANKESKANNTSYLKLLIDIFISYSFISTFLN